ncbi:hypothetical protein D1BOALGB6SA_2675 [Olavius sp. associated proteobacterium Delta 1]|nr:hypothetical protein D1BOALGB6SA_2675 [Olavius sp. associated proteobacterium Delta 1]
MNQTGRSRALALNDNRIMRFLFLAGIFLMALTGFGQMPIYKRYYMADIPGFGWLANFYTTRYVHYLGAALLLALLSYFLFDYFFLRRNNLKVTRTGYLRIMLLAGIVITGIFFVVKNFPVHYFSHEFIIILNLSHLGFVMGFLFVSLYCLIFKKRWTAIR